MRSRLSVLLLLLLTAGCGLGGSDCPRTGRFVITSLASGETTVHDECLADPEVQDFECPKQRWDFTGPDGRGGDAATFLRFEIGDPDVCGVGFAARDTDGRLYSGRTQRAWDAGSGPFATGDWNRTAGGQVDAGSFSFYEREDVFP